MSNTTFEELLEAGCHFGHLTRKWNPKMAPYIFMERNGIHIIDLHKTAVKLDTAAAALKQIVKSGRKVLFVATKKQAKSIVAEKVSAVNMPYVTERWPGGMLTNFPTIRKAVKKMTSIDKMESDGTFAHLSKREKLQISRQRAKLEKNLGSIADLTRLPAALFVVDVMKEYIAVREANRLGIPVFAIVDTNSTPEGIDFVIPANDDASNSVSIILDKVTLSIKEGLSERKVEKEKEAAEKKSRPKRTKKEEAKADDEEETADIPTEAKTVKKEARAEKAEAETTAKETKETKPKAVKKEAKPKAEKTEAETTAKETKETKPKAVKKEAKPKKEEAKTTKEESPVTDAKAEGEEK